MKVENLVTEPMKQTYKVGVYGGLAVCALSLASFIAWSFTCIGGAVYQIMA